MINHNVRLTSCPNCGKKLDTATGVGHDRTPKPRDFSVCLYCKALLVFNEDLSIRPATKAEAAEFMLYQVRN